MRRGKTRTLELMPMKMAGITKGALLAALVLGAIVGTALFIAAGDHNPSQVFHGAEHSSFMRWMLVGVSWFAATIAVTFPVLWAVAWVALRFLSRREQA